MIARRILAFGASTCEGKGDPQGGGFVGRLKTWREIEDYQQNYVYNLGISGNTSSDVLKRFLPEAKPRHPDLVIFQFGGNDIRREGSGQAEIKISLAEYIDNVTQLIFQVKQISQVMFISSIPIDDSKTQPISWVPYYYAQKDVAIYALKLQEICAYHQVPYLDILNDWLKQDYLKYLHIDGLHPSVLGHQNIFEQLKTKLLEL